MSGERVLILERDADGADALAAVFAAGRLEASSAARLSREEFEAAVEDGARRVFRPPPGAEPESGREQAARDSFAVYRGRDRRSMVARLAGYLLYDGVEPMLALSFAQSWNLVHAAPPLSPAAVEATVRWVAARQTEELREREAT